MQIGIIGSGISGLSVAWLLSQRYEVTLIEKSASLGMSHLNSDFEGFSIDVPLRIFSNLYHENLFKFYSYLGEEFEQATLSASFCFKDRIAKAQFKAFMPDLVPVYLPSLTNLSNLSSLWGVSWQGAVKIAQATRFYAETLRAIGQNLDTLSFGQFLQERRLKDEGYQQYVAPFLLLAFSCTHELLETLSAGMVLRFIRLFVVSRWYRLRNGSTQLAEKLANKIAVIKTNCAVESIVLPKGKVKKIQVVCPDKVHKFDHVVLAVEAKQVPLLLQNESCFKHELFKRFSYKLNTVWVHSDKGLMPKQKRHWSQVNYFLNQSKDDEISNYSTVWLNSFPSFKARLDYPVFQSFNPSIEPKEEYVLTKSKALRAIMTPESLKATQEIKAMQGHKNLWFCGSYVEPGGTLQEESLLSAMYIAKEFGIEIPWL